MSSRIKTSAIEKLLIACCVVSAVLIVVFAQVLHGWLLALIVCPLGLVAITGVIMLGVRRGRGRGENHDT